MIVTVRYGKRLESCIKKVESNVVTFIIKLCVYCASTARAIARIGLLD